MTAYAALAAADGRLRPSVLVAAVIFVLGANVETLIAVRGSASSTTAVAMLLWPMALAVIVTPLALAVSSMQSPA